MSGGIWLMRHGVLPRNPGRRFVGQRDLPLSKVGRKQAASWQRHLKDVPFIAVVCSDLSRCVETAQLVTSERGIPLILEPAFREISLGFWEGLTPNEVEKRFPGAYVERGKDMARFRPEGGESFTDLAERVLPAFDKWHRHSSGRHLLIVAHAGVNRVIIARYMALPLEYVSTLPQPYGCCASLADAYVE